MSHTRLFLHFMLASADTPPGFIYSVLAEFEFLSMPARV